VTDFSKEDRPSSMGLKPLNLMGARFLDSAPFFIKYSFDFSSLLSLNKMGSLTGPQLPTEFLH
jgi:hypothetical protein